MSYIISRSHKSGKKMMVKTPDGSEVHFGQSGASDYTKHENYHRMIRYLSRHAGIMNTDADKIISSRREKWGINGVKTAGFWSRWLLWNKPSLEQSKQNIEKNFGIKIILK